MAELGSFVVKARFDLFGDLVAQLSDEGLSNLASSITAERFRREQLAKLEAA